jgi:hypothetical protein
MPRVTFAEADRRLAELETSVSGGVDGSLTANPTRAPLPMLPMLRHL